MACLVTWLHQRKSSCAIYMSACLCVDEGGLCVTVRSFALAFALRCVLCCLLLSHQQAVVWKGHKVYPREKVGFLYKSV